MSFALRCSLWFYVLVAVLGAPRRSSKSLVPTWYLPCGGEMETEAPEAANFDEDVSASLGSLSFQHKMTLDNYLTRDYEYLYERVRIGVHQHQYIPNWVPGKKDVNRIKSLANATPQMVGLPRACNPVGFYTSPLLNSSHSTRSRIKVYRSTDVNTANRELLFYITSSA